MTFVEAFYSCALELCDANRGVYTKVRLKTAKHPYESMTHLAARILAFCHSYEENQEFSQGLFQPQQPTIWKRDFAGELLSWVQVGATDKKKLQRALRERCCSRFLVYLYEQSQMDEMCQLLRGSCTNWVERVTFYQMDPALPEEIGQSLGIRSKWELTVSDELIFLLVDGVSFHSAIREVNIWKCYQVSIDNV